MASLDSDKVITALRTKLGCYEEDDRDHFIYWVLDPQSGKKLRYTKVSHGPKHTLGPNLVGQMARQLALNSGQFTNFVSCTMSADEVLKIVKESDMS